MRVGLNYDLNIDKVLHRLGPAYSTNSAEYNEKHNYLDIELCLKTDKVMKKAVWDEIMKYDPVLPVYIRQIFIDYIEQHMQEVESALFKLKPISGSLKTHIWVDVKPGGTKKSGWIKVSLRFWRGNCDAKTVQAVILELFKTQEEKEYAKRKRK